MLRRDNGGSDGLYGVYDDDFGDDSDGDVVGDDDDDTFWINLCLICSTWENYLYKTNL